MEVLLGSVITLFAVGLAELFRLRSEMILRSRDRWEQMLVDLIESTDEAMAFTLQAMEAHSEEAHLPVDLRIGFAKANSRAMSLSRVIGDASLTTVVDQFCGPVSKVWVTPPGIQRHSLFNKAVKGQSHVTLRASQLLGKSVVRVRAINRFWSWLMVRYERKK